MSASSIVKTGRAYVYDSYRHARVCREKSTLHDDDDDDDNGQRVVVLCFIIFFERFIGNRTPNSCAATAAAPTRRHYGGSSSSSFTPERRFPRTRVQRATSYKRRLRHVSRTREGGARSRNPKGFGGHRGP